MSDSVDELVEWQLEQGCRRGDGPGGELLACGYPEDERVSQPQHGHRHSYHCHLSPESYW